jgi:hypothetical protein
MNRQPFERILRVFISDVPEVAPRDLLESVLIELPTVPQRRRLFGVGWRFRKMSMPLRALATAAVVLVVAVAAFSILPRSAGVGSGPPPSPTASPTASPSTVASPTPTATPRIAGATVIGDGATLETGVRYVTPRIDPLFTFTGSSKLLFLADGPRYAWFGATTPRTEMGVVAAGSAFDETGATIEIPSDITAWLEDRSDLDIVSTTPVELGATSGTLIEAKVHPDAHANGGGAVNLFCPGPVDRCQFEEGGSLGYVPGNHLLLLVTSVGDKPVVAAATAPEVSWPQIGSDAEAFLRSFEFPGQ